jgi:hypothetical protein
VIGMGHQVEVRPAEPVVGHVAVAARRAQQQGERIASEREEGGPREPVAGAGRTGRITERTGRV